MKHIILIAFFLTTITLIAQANPKRVAPKEPKPAIAKNIKYMAPTGEKGYIVAKDVKTDSVLWKKQVYKISYKKGLETDVQDVFIDSLRLEGKYLIVRREDNKIYKIKID